MTVWGCLEFVVWNNPAFAWEEGVHDISLAGFDYKVGVWPNGSLYINHKDKALISNARWFFWWKEGDVRKEKSYAMVHPEIIKPEAAEGDIIKLHYEESMYGVLAKFSIREDGVHIDLLLTAEPMDGFNGMTYQMLIPQNLIKDASCRLIDNNGVPGKQYNKLPSAPGGQILGSVKGINFATTFGELIIDASEGRFSLYDYTHSGLYGMNFSMAGKEMTKSGIEKRIKFKITMEQSSGIGAEKDPGPVWIINLR